MTTNTKATLAVVLAALAVVVTALFAFRTGTPEPTAAGQEPPGAAASGAAPAGPVVPPELLVREDSHRLSTAADGKATLVEFLDFECPACRAAYPAIEELRAGFGDRITFVVRYFPIPSHPNAENAAVAVEAAAAQGRFVDMYRTMYETQPNWANRADSQAGVFRGFAVDLGLDLAAYDRVVADPATLERVLRDRADGTAAGVQGTPTFFLNGARVQPTSVNDLRALVDAALAR